MGSALVGLEPVPMNKVNTELYMLVWHMGQFRLVKVGTGWFARGIIPRAAIHQSMAGRDVLSGRGPVQLVS